MKNKWFTSTLITMLIISYNVYSQQNEFVDKWIDYLDDAALSAQGEALAAELYDELSYRAEHPYNLNTVTAEELRKLPFLSDEQIAYLLDHIRKYGPMVTLYELKNVEALERETIQLLLPFVYAGTSKKIQRPVTFHNLLKYGKHELAFRYDHGLQQKKGYRQTTDNLQAEADNKRYLGEPFYHSLRYSFGYAEHFQLGLITEKDGGEPFVGKVHRGYDYYSAHLFLKDFGILKGLAVGDYKLSFGQGLVFSQDFTPGRSVNVTQAERRTNGVRRHYSTNENDFLRGVAGTFSVGNMEASLFYSFRKLDATVEEGAIRSFKTDGLHRLVREVEKRNQVSMQTIGGNVRYATPAVCIGVTALSYSFGNKTVDPVLQPYNRYMFRGTSNFNMSVDYMLKVGKSKFYGETAVSQHGAMAILHAFQLVPASYAKLLLLYRRYSKRFHAFFGNAFAQGSSVQNEEGIYMGMEIDPFACWKISAYVDFFRFPWLKYGIDKPSSGSEYMIQADYTQNRGFAVYVRYKYRDKEVSTRQSIRLQAKYEVGRFSMRTAADGICYRETARNSVGWALSQQWRWQPASSLFQVELYTAYFQTDDFFSRIYSYEKNVLYGFSMPSFYGKGMRMVGSLKWNINRHFSLSVKCSNTWHMDHSVIGNGLEEIQGRHKTDIYTLLRWKF